MLKKLVWLCVVVCGMSAFDAMAVSTVKKFGTSVPAANTTTSTTSTMKNLSTNRSATVSKTVSPTKTIKSVSGTGTAPRLTTFNIPKNVGTNLKTVYTGGSTNAVNNEVTGIKNDLSNVQEDVQNISDTVKNIEEKTQEVITTVTVTDNGDYVTDIHKSDENTLNVIKSNPALRIPIRDKNNEFTGEYAEIWVVK